MNDQIIQAIRLFAKEHAEHMDLVRLTAYNKQQLYSYKDIRDKWKFYNESLYPDQENVLNFYLHIPFCYKKCSYCDFYSFAPENQHQVEEYVCYIHDYLEYFKDSFANTVFRNFYIGGGTPSLLNEEQLETLLGAVFNNYQFGDSGERTLECNPVNITIEKLEIIKKYNFNRVSMGVQTFNKEALRLSNRDYSTKDIVAEAVELINSFEYELGLNVDLIRCLKGDDPDDFLNTFEELAKLGPDTIIVYPIRPPRQYLNDHFEGSYEKFSSFYNGRNTFITNNLPRVALKYGYFSGIFDDSLNRNSAWNFASSQHINKQMLSLTELERKKGLIDFDALKEESLKNTYNDIPLIPASIFGVGPSSRSKIFGSSSYISLEMKDLQFKENESVIKGKDIDVYNEFTNYFILSMREESSIRISSIKKYFGNQIFTELSKIIELLVEMDLCEINEDTIRLISDKKADMLFICMLIAAHGYFRTGKEDISELFQMILES